MKFLRPASRVLLVLGVIQFLLTASLACMKGAPCFLTGYGSTILFVLPALFWTGKPSRIVAALVIALSAYGFVDNWRAAHDPLRGMARVALLQGMSNARQIARAAQDGGYPADLPVQTDRQYIEYLVQHGALNERDLAVLIYNHARAHSLAELSGATISFTIYRVSKDDPPETVFLALKPERNAKASILIRKDGTGFYGRRADLDADGPLPPRQPVALQAVP
jgi:hypothetical protein